MPRIRKKTSKRSTTHQRAKFQHKVSESRKKKKKEAKKNPQWKSRKPKELGIPSNYPFKEQVLAEAAEAKRLAEEEKQKRKEQKAAAKAAAKRGDVPLKSADDVEAQEQPEANDEHGDSEVPLLKDADLPSLKDVLEEADFVIQVLDARDPLPYRNQWLEDRIRSSNGKRLGFILNKIDLVPLEAATQWRDFLREEAPTVLFHASSKDIAADGLSSKDKSKGHQDEIIPTVGIEALHELLSCWASEKESLKVAFVGMVNSGKSSIINALTKRTRVPVYSHARPGPGFSTTPYPIRVPLQVQGHLIELIDTPGLMKQNDDNQSTDIRVRDMLFRNKGKVDKVKDPLPAVNYIVSRSKAEDLMVLYALPAFPDKDTNGFLKGFARSRAFVQKKGELDLQGAAKSLLKDWASNQFPFYTLPPARELQSITDEKLKLIYQRFDSAALDGLKSINALWADGGLVKFDASGIDTREVNLVPPKPSAREKDEDEEEDEEDSEDEESEDDREEDEDEESDSEEAPPPPSKRKRQEQGSSDRNVKPKKVAFAKEVLKKTKNGEIQKGRIHKVGNAKKSGMGGASKEDDDTYDFSKFF